MKNLSRAASSCYFDLSVAAYELRLIGWAQVLDRMAALKGLCTPKDPVRIRASRILALEGYECSDEWMYIDGGRDPQQAQANTSQTGYGPSSESDEEDDDNYMHFYAPPTTGLGNWCFHQYDDDHFPSVPHGHWLGRPKPKLDAYLGWVYEGSRQLRRESRKSIVALWNNPAFREVAISAVRYYLSHFPSYSGWRVADPLKLPRRRIVG